MFVSTSDYIPGFQYQILGLVRGNVVSSKNIGRDLMASTKSIVGGEIKSYTMMLDEARTTAEQRMVDAAQNLGADGVIGVRFTSGNIMQGTVEMLAYGTAIKLITGQPAE